MPLPLNKQALIHVGVVFSILIISVLAYFKSLYASFVNWDDTVYIVDNSLLNVRSIQNIVQIFSQSFEGHYHPFTLLSLAFDRFIGNQQPFYFHLHNLVLHLVNCLLVFRFVQVLIQKRLELHPGEDSGFRYFGLLLPALVTGFFALHTLNTEAVAWATARKDLLYSFYFLLSLLFFLHSGKSKKFYVFALVAFLFSILSKGQAVMLPFCLVLIHYFLGKPVWKGSAFKPFIPFFLLAFIMGVIAIVAQQSTGYTRDQAVQISLAENIGYPAYAFVLYLIKLAFPAGLSAWYAYPEGGAGLAVWLSLPVFLAFLAGMIMYRKKYPWLVFGAGFFLVNIFPFLKWIPVSNYIIADRYVYLAGLGFFIPLAYGLVRLMSRSQRLGLITGAGVLLVFALLFVNTRNRVEVWNNSLSLLNDILEKDPKVYTALNARGDVYKDAGQTTAALADFEAAIRVRPDAARAYGNRAGLLAESGDCESALPDFDKALSLDPDQAGVRVNRARCLNLRGDFKAALEDLRIARNSGFQHLVLDYETGIAYYNLREFRQAIDCFNRVADQDPAYPSLFTYRGFAWFHLGEDQAALADLNLSIAANPDNAVAWAIRGLVKARNGDSSGCDDLRKAQKMGLVQVKNELVRYCGE